MMTFEFKDLVFTDVVDCFCEIHIPVGWDYPDLSKMFYYPVFWTDHGKREACMDLGSYQYSEVAKFVLAFRKALKSGDKRFVWGVSK